MKILNIEMKARCNDLDSIRGILQELGAESRGIDHQVDTYYEVEEGRLKLRQGNIENALIFYKRQNIAGLKDSHILLEKLTQESNLPQILNAALKKFVVVDKAREILFIENVKFHLDSVKTLGTFVEIEAIGKLEEKEKLQAQAEKYLNCFMPYLHEMIHGSYSDLVKSNSIQFEKNMHDQARSFLDDVNNLSKKIKLDTNTFKMDHLCYRVESHVSYEEYKANFELIGTLLIEAKVNGRLISTFKLYNPIIYHDRRIYFIELPQPKESSKYKNGFEHVEYLVDESFEVFASKNQHCHFTNEIVNEKNSGLKLKISDQFQIKFKHKSLEEIIEEEKG